MKLSNNNNNYHEDCLVHRRNIYKSDAVIY